MNTKKRNRKITIGLLAGLTLSFTFAVTSVSASSILESLETEANYAEDTQYSLRRGNNLNLGTSAIARLSSNEVHIYGVTECHHECDNVYLELYLERKRNGVYSTYDYWQFEETDVDSLEIGMDVAVPSGYYYRVRAYHAASDGGSDIESVETLTDGIKVS